MTFELEPGRPPGTAKEMIFYDGRCGLCHWLVRFAVKRDRAEVFHFAPLDGERFHAAVPASRRTGLPDSIIVRDAEGALLVRSEAVIHILIRLGGPWRRMASLLRPVPRSWRDGLYDGLARIRHRLFRTPAEVCPVLPAHLRARFRS